MFTSAEAAIETDPRMESSAERPSSRLGLSLGESRSGSKPKASIAGIIIMAWHKLLVLEPIKHHREWQSMKIHRGVEMMVCLPQGDSRRGMKLDNDEVLEFAG